MKKSIFGFLHRRKKSSTIEQTMEQDTSKKTEQISNQPVAQDPIEAMAKNIGSAEVKMKTYDILVFDIDPDTGRQKQTPVTGVKATCPQELVALYANCDQKIRILREYGGEEPSANPLVQQVPQQRNTKIQQPKAQTNADDAEPKQQSTTTVNKQIEEIIHAQVPTKPHFFEVGGIKCKMENGHVFQEQWCRVDASKYRLISDVNNKEISMSGKHLETLKWVLIEESNGGN